MTVSTAVRSPHRLRRGSLAALAAAVAVAGGATATATATVAAGGGDGTETVRCTPSLSELLAPLTPEQRLYVEQISSATPEQLAVWFGTDGVR
jgi:hypothetical protein